MKGLIFQKSSIILLVFVGFLLLGQSSVTFADVEAQVEAMLSQMTVAEKVGQMLMVAQVEVDPCDVQAYKLGAILVNVGENQNLNVVQWANRFDNYQNVALATRLAIPLLVATDAVHGHNNAYRATVFPHNIGLGATGDPNLMYRIGKIAALEVAATGCDMTLAPCVAVPRDIRWGRTYEGWGEDPLFHDKLVGELIRGFQEPYNGLDFIATTAKHYIADGGSLWGTGVGGKIDQGNCLLTEEQLRAIHLPPYKEAIDMNCQAIMPSYGKYQGVEMHHEQYLLTDVLKTELGFDGLVVSDYGGIYDINSDARTSIKSAINAGIDMSMENTGWLTFITELTDLIDTSEVPMSRIDDAVRRILRVKYRAGVFDQPLADRTVTNGRTFGSAEHRAVAREAVRKSCVLLKNQGNILPLSRDIDVFVAGNKADDMASQCGGWTIDWGVAPALRLPPGKTLIEAIESAIGYVGTVTYSSDGTGSEGKDIVIAIAGENSYAEWYGDSSSINITSADVTMLTNVAALEIPKVLVLIGGRPMVDVNDFGDDFDAIVMAWLPGTEGDGVADVLFGEYPFTGVLSLSWMKDTAQLPMHPEDANYDPLFPLGAGLTTIEFDSASSASDGAGQTTTLSWSHTIGNGQDRVLAVGVSAADTSAADLVVTGVTYNGVAMTTISDTNSIAGDTNLIATELYYMPESNLPATGTYTAQVTYAGSVEDITAGAVSLANVMQQPAEVVAISADPNASTISTSVATLSEGTWLIDVLGTADPCVMTKGVVQTTRWSQSSDISSAACSTRVIPAPRPVSMDWRGPNETILVQSVAAFKPIQIIYPDETDLNGDFVLDLIDIGIFMNQWNPGSLPDPAPDNLVSMWKFDEASGTYAADSIGVNHGTTNAGWTDGKASSAIDFDGTEIVNCGNDISLDITNRFTISLWAKLDPNHGGVLINKGIGNALEPNGVYTISYDPCDAGTLTFSLRASDNTTTQSVEVAPFAAEDWTHIVARYRDFYMSICVNGEVITETLILSLNMNTNDQDLAIGGYADGTEIITGAIDDVRIYNRKITDDEIEAMLPCYMGAGCVDIDGEDGVNWVDYAEFMKGWNP